METADRLNAILAGKWMPIQLKDTRASVPRRIDRVVDGDADEMVALLSSGDPADGARVYEVDLDGMVFFDDLENCALFCETENSAPAGDVDGVPGE